MSDSCLDPVAQLCDQFAPLFHGYTWPQVIAALSVSLEAAMQCYAKQAGVPMPMDVADFLHDIALHATDDTIPVRES